MDSALKFAVTISAIIVVFYAIIGIIGGFMNSGMVCWLGIEFVVLTFFFWIAYIIGRAMWNTEKKIWRWMNEEEK